jgi:hypothetical protein
VDLSGELVRGVTIEKRFIRLPKLVQLLGKGWIRRHSPSHLLGLVGFQLIKQEAF